MYLSNSPNDGISSTVMVTDIPAVAEHTSKQVAAKKKSDAEKKKAEKKAGGSTQTSDGGSGDEGLKDSKVVLDVGAATFDKATTLATLRQRKKKVQEYDLLDTSLDPKVMAAQTLASGITPKVSSWGTRLECS